MRDVVVLSTQYWDGPKFRKHQFALRFADAGARVLYVEPTHSIVRSRSYTGDAGNPLLASTSRTVAERLTVLTPHRVVPKPNVPAVSAFNRRWIAADVRREIRRLGIGSDALALVYDVEWSPALDSLGIGPAVMDVVDDLVDYESDPVRRAYVYRCIREVGERSALQVFTSAPLAQRYGDPVRSVIIPNGFDETLFHAGVAGRRISSGAGPVVGFVGTLFRYIDYEKLLALAVGLPDVQLALVGRKEDDSAGLEKLASASNVTLHGAVAPAEVPAIVVGFDVCVAPFVVGGVADAVSPLKVYEYLAMGKRVVCTPLRGLSLDSIAPLLTFADDTDAFVDGVRDALDDPGLPRGWEAIVARRSWSALHATLVEALVDAGIA